MTGPPLSDEAVVDIDSHCLLSLSETVQVSLGSNRKITGETSRSSSRGAELLETAGVVPENILIPSAVMNSSCAEPCSEADDDLPALENYVSQLESRVARLESEKDLLNREVLRLDSINLCLSAQNKDLKNQIGENRIALQRRNNLLLQARLRLRDLVRQNQEWQAYRASGEPLPSSPAIKLESQPIRKRSAGRTIIRNVGRANPGVQMPRRRVYRGEVFENEMHQASGVGLLSDEDMQNEAVKEMSSRRFRRSEGAVETAGTARQRHVAQNSSRTRQKREASQAPAKPHEAALSERNKRNSQLSGPRQNSISRKWTDTITVNEVSESGAALRCISPGLKRTSLPPLTEAGARERSNPENQRKQPGEPLGLLPRDPTFNLHRFASTPAEKAIFDSISKAVREPQRSGKLEKYLSKSRPSSRRPTNDPSAGEPPPSGWASDTRSRSASACKSANGDPAVVPSTVSDYRFTVRPHVEPLSLYGQVGPACPQPENSQRTYPPSPQYLASAVPHFPRPATKSANLPVYGRYDVMRNAHPAGLADHRVYPVFSATMKSPKESRSNTSAGMLI